MLQTEEKIIKVLTEFNFGFVDTHEFSLTLDSYYKNYLNGRMDEYSKMGWREKIIFSFFLITYDKKDYLKKIEKDIFINPNGKELKSYLLVIMLMSDEKTKQNTLYRLLNEFDLFVPQKEWVFASSLLTDNKNFYLSINVNSEKYFNKYLKAIEIINKIRLLNHSDLIKVKFI